MKGFSFFEVKKSQEQLILRSFNKHVRRNRQLIKVELSNESRGDRQKREPQDQYSTKKQYSDNWNKSRKKGRR
jgi:hypothetical protein